MAREQFQTLTEPMYYILIALSEECCGVDIMEKVQKISGGRVKVGPGTLYTMLSKFEENQIIFRTKEEGRRKSYVITEHGRKLLQEEHERLCIMLADWNRNNTSVTQYFCLRSGELFQTGQRLLCLHGLYRTKNRIDRDYDQDNNGTLRIS